MSIAETAELAVNLKLGTTGSFAGATAQLKGVEAAAAGASARGVSALQAGFGKMQVAAGKFSGALNHAKGAIGGLLSGPLGVLGLAGGVAGLGVAFTHIIEHTNDFAFSVEKLMGLTGASAESMSTLLAVFEKYNISAERTGNIVGFTEKTLGKLAATSAGAKSGISALAKVDQQYGIHLVDNKGKVVAFDEALRQVADVYASNAQASSKAALAAKIFGRGYADMVPILRLGRKGIDDASAAAKELGLTLTASNAKDLAAYRKSLRETADAVGGLELQLGLVLVPAIKDVADAVTSFLRHGGREQLVGFFKGAIVAARNLAGVVTQSVIPAISAVAGVVKTAWDSIPPEFRDLIIKGFIADKTVKFLFGFSPITFAKDAIGNALATGLGKSLATAGIGKFFVQPVFVTNPGFGLGGGLPGAAGEAAAAGGGASLLSLGLAGLVAAGIIAASVPIGQAFAAALPSWLKGPGGQGQSQSQQARAAADAAQFHGVIAPTLLDRGGRERGTPGIAGIITGLVRSMTKAAVAATALQAFIDALRHATTDLQRQTAARAVIHAIDAGRGNLARTEGGLEALKKALKETHDPKLAAELRKDIAKVERVLPGREFAAKELATADKILASHKTAAQKIADLKTVAQALKDHGLPAAAKNIQTRIDAAKKAQVDATNAAKQATVNAIAKKDLSVVLNASTFISIRDLAGKSQIMANYTTVGSRSSSSAGPGK